MNILISTPSQLTSGNRTYTTYMLSTEKKSVRVMLVSGASTYVNVVVNNAAHKVFKGMGKDYKTVNQAIDAYKCPQVRAMLSSMNTLTGITFN